MTHWPPVTKQPHLLCRWNDESKVLWVSWSSLLQPVAMGEYQNGVLNYETHVIPAHVESTAKVRAQKIGEVNKVFLWTHSLSLLSSILASNLRGLTCVSFLLWTELSVNPQEAAMCTVHVHVCVQHSYAHSAFICVFYTHSTFTCIFHKGRHLCLLCSLLCTST